MLRPWVPLAGIVLALAAIVVAAVLAGGWVPALFWGGGALLLVSLLAWLGRPAPQQQPTDRAPARSPLDGR
jgi:uncharacterized membrane protein YfcA